MTVLSCVSYNAAFRRSNSATKTSHSPVGSVVFSGKIIPTLRMTKLLYTQCDNYTIGLQTYVCYFLASL